MLVSNNIDFSNNATITGFYKFNNVTASSTSQLVSTNDTLFYFEIPANAQSFNPSKCRLIFTATVTAAGANNQNILLLSVSPVSRCEIKTWGGQTIYNMWKCQAFAKTLPDRLQKSDNSLSSLPSYNGRSIKTGTLVYDYFNASIHDLDDAVNVLISADAAGTFSINYR